MIKKFSLAMAVAFSVLAITSCKDEDPVSSPAVSVNPTTLTFSYDEDATGAASQTVSLTATRTWTASVSDDCVTVSPAGGMGQNAPQTVTISADKNDAQNKTVTVTFAISTGQTATLTVNVEGKMADQQSISDVYGLAEGATAEISGVVAGVSTRSFVVKDDTGLLLVYLGDDAAEAGVAVGDAVTVSGTTAKYGDLIQLTAPTVNKTGTAAVDDLGTPLAITAANISTFDITKVSYITMTGVYTTSGNYRNLVIEGTEVQGSIQYPVESLGLDALTNHNVTLTGFFAGGNNAKYRNILVTEVKDNGAVETASTSVAEVLAAETGTLVKTSGTVMAICTKGYIVADNTGAIYVYTNATPEVAVGNTVTVEGTRAEYSGCQQISSPTTKVTNASTAAPTYPTAKELTGAALDTYEVTVSEYVKVSGKLNGRTITVDGATRSISLNYPTDDLGYSAMNGLNVTLCGYVSNLYTGDSYTTLYIIASAIEAEPYLSATNAGVAASATSASIEVSSNVNWTVEKVSGDWATLNTTSGSNNGTIEVSFSANTDAAERTAEFKITGTGIDTPVIVTLSQMGTAAKSYVKVTSAPSDWSGTYLIVYDESNPGKVFTGAISTNKTTYGLHADVTISSSTITGDATISGYEVTIAAVGTSYSMQCGAGYLGWSSGNSLKASASLPSNDNGYLWNIGFANDGTFSITNAGTPARILQYNTGSPRFACYTGSQKNAVLYKLAE